MTSKEIGSVEGDVVGKKMAESTISILGRIVEW